MMEPVVTFVIPVRHQDNAKDWGHLKANLTQTIASVAAQSRNNWRAVIVANEGADLPAVPLGFEIERVQFPPNPAHDLAGGDKEAVYDAFRLDKGRRVLAGMLRYPRSKFFMIVDDDDFVSNRIVEFVEANQDANGWKIGKGYVWSEGGAVLFKHDDFSSFCGTSLIVRGDLYALPRSVAEADVDYIKTMLGSHVRIGPILEEKGAALDVLPFRGAVYRVGHRGAHSNSTGLWRLFFFNRGMLTRPVRLVQNVFRILPLGVAQKREFFGATT
jgi:hypothetical protein